jgi:membrane-bound lytic murein transglycosylase A
MGYISQIQEPVMKTKKKPLIFTLGALAILALLLSACSSKELKITTLEEPVLLRPVSLEEWPNLEDDSDRESLETAVRYSLNYLKNRPADERLIFSDREITRKEQADSLALFLTMLEEQTDHRRINRQLKEVFNLYRLVRAGGPAPLLMTGYYEPVLQGSRKGSAPFLYPVYRVPDDLVFVQAGLFSDSLKGRKWTGRLNGRQVVPYYTRKEIDQEGSLKGKKLEILWVEDPIKLFFMHIQGSGQVRLEDGSEIHLGYAGANGHSYFPIGRELVQKGYLKPEEVSLQSISAYLRDHPDEKQGLMNLNSSYVFFREVPGGPVGSLGFPLTPERSVAVDPKFFPSGGLGWISGLKPQVDEKGQIRSWVHFRRWVCFQDTGGAIKGPSRLDLYWGSGEKAEMAAGHLKHPGSVFILLKK